jgi:murein DD-endopeptidase MepM/ murein hydrolase activator NlpD
MIKIVAVAVAGALALGGVSGALRQASTSIDASCGVDTTVHVSGFTGVQTLHAAQIMATGQQMHIPRRGQVIAVAVALQEAGLKMYANDNPAYPLVVQHSLALPHDAVGHDHDSVGLFQQRPNPPEGAGGWGTVKQLMNASTSSRKFYTALEKVHGWQQMPLNQIAQIVQMSAFPDAYQKWESGAATLVTALSGHTSCSATGKPGPSGWIQPVRAAITSGFGTRGGVLHAGVDLGAPRGTDIGAAAPGLVTWAGCDRATGDCNHDGSINTAGCGWYVEIKHTNGIGTRYCHMISRPTVHEGQTVKAGQLIGHVGMSGNADGPHLHFEVHLHNDMSPSGATDPVAFMRGKGVPLGLH